MGKEIVLKVIDEYIDLYKSTVLSKKSNPSYLFENFSVGGSSNRKFELINLPNDKNLQKGGFIKQYHKWLNLRQLIENNNYYYALHDFDREVSVAIERMSMFKKQLNKFDKNIQKYNDWIFELQSAIVELQKLSGYNG